MDIRCNVRALRDSLAVAASATGGSKGANQIFTNVLGTVVAGGLELYATDNESAVMVLVPATSSDVGTKVILPPRRLLAILNELTGDDVTLIISDNGIRVKASGADFRLANESADEFPKREMFEGAEFFQVEGSILRRMVHRTGYASDIASTRYALGGVLFDFEDDKLTCAATDSRRLAVCSAAIKQVGMTEDAKGVVPSKALKLLDKLPDAMIDVYMTDKAIHFRAEGFECSSRLVEGRFPRYRDVIPRPQGATVVVVTAVAAASAVRQSQVVTTEESRAVSFSLKENMILIESETGDVGSSRIELSASVNNLTEMTVMLDPKYVLDFLKTMRPEDTVNWAFLSGDDAVVMTDDQDYVYVMMPVAHDR